MLHPTVDVRRKFPSIQRLTRRTTFDLRLVRGHVQQTATTCTYSVCSGAISPPWGSRGKKRSRVSVKNMSQINQPARPRATKAEKMDMAWGNQSGRIIAVPPPRRRCPDFSRFDDDDADRPDADREDWAVPDDWLRVFEVGRWV